MTKYELSTLSLSHFVDALVIASPEELSQTKERFGSMALTLHDQPDKAIVWEGLEMTIINYIFVRVITRKISVRVSSGHISNTGNW